MAAHVCPLCGQPGPRWLESSSAGTALNYYRCPACGEVWVVPKAEPGARPRTIAAGTIVDRP
jgi:transposase-like protein